MNRELARRRRVCIVATTPFPLNVFMRPHIEALRSQYDITLVANGSCEDVTKLVGQGVSFVPVEIERRISFGKDCRAFVSLWRLFRRERFDCVHSIMPKSGLLAMVAARLAGVPLRFHTFTGQVWATRTGSIRFFLKVLDRVLVANATMVLADSPSQRSFVVEQKVARESAIRVLADGSICGVDSDRFAFSAEARQRVRSRHAIPDDAFVFLYLGRLNEDKGIPDLLGAFASVAERAPRVHLLVVGPDEANFASEFYRLTQQFEGRVHRVGYTNRPEDSMSAADVFCLPSYREGFANVIIEAAAAGVPAVASDIYGITDAVEKNVTGFLHTPRSVSEISYAMTQLLNDRELRRQMGMAARARAVARFSEQRVTKALVDFYRESFIANQPTDGGQRGRG